MILIKSLRQFIPRSLSALRGCSASIHHGVLWDWYSLVSLNEKQFEGSFKAGQPIGKLNNGIAATSVIVKSRVSAASLDVVFFELGYIYLEATDGGSSSVNDNEGEVRCPLTTLVKRSSISSSKIYYRPFP